MVVMVVEEGATAEVAEDTWVEVGATSVVVADLTSAVVAHLTSAVVAHLIIVGAAHISEAVTTERHLRAAFHREASVAEARCIMLRRSAVRLRWDVQCPAQ